MNNVKGKKKTTAFIFKPETKAKFASSVSTRASVYLSDHMKYNDELTDIEEYVRENTAAVNEFYDTIAVRSMISCSYQQGNPMASFNHLVKRCADNLIHGYLSRNETDSLENIIHQP